MVPQTQKRPPRNSSKVNLIISLVMHGALCLVLVYFAARQGLLGKAIKKIAELGWKPVQFLGNAAASTSTTMGAAGLDASRDIISAVYLKDPADPQWKDDGGIKEFRAFMSKYYPDGDQENGTTVFGYGAAKAFVEVLRQCGDNLTRSNIMKQMASLDMTIDVYLPGIQIRTSKTDYAPIDQLQPVKFSGHRFEPFGDVIGGK